MKTQESNENAGDGSVVSDDLFCVGDRVHWMHTTRRGRAIEMGTREGKITSIFEGVIIVKMRNGRKVQVNAKNLRREGEKTEVNDVFEAMSDGSQNVEFSVKMRPGV